MNERPEHPVHATPAGSPGGGPPAGARIGAYVVERAAGRGGTASVLVVRHVETGQVSAMKVLHGVGDDERLRSRFRREFRALSRLLHPNVLRVEEWGIHEGRPWFTMELVEGTDLRDAIDAWEHLPADERFARIQSVLVQVTRALAYIHERGLVHRDVSPGNVMIRADGVVKLMDFGLVTDPSADVTTVGEIVGTVAHTAPEQLRGERVDARADLYALGTVLYQMLTGRKPFSAHTVQGWVERHLHEKPRPPRELEPLVPEHLERVCLRLLEKNPEDRFASAMHLLQVLGDTEPVTDADHWPPRAVGRTGVKAWLRETLDDVVARHRGGALLLTGGSGSGKSRMLDLADQQARRRGVRVARARCRAHDRAFGTFAELLRQLDPPRVPPVLRGALEGAQDAPVERYPVIAAFREVVEASAPCVLLVDQVERADVATRELLEYLVRNTLELAEVPVAYVLTLEVDDPEAASGALAGLSALEREHLGPLALAEVEEVVMSVLPDVDVAEALARRVHEETDGSPAYVADILHGLVDEGILRRRGSRWELTIPPDALEASHLPLPARLRTVLEDRIAPLGEDARQVGRLLAVARSPLDLDVLVQAAPFDEERVMTAVDVLLDADIVVERRTLDHDIVELSHARFRDVLLHGQPPDAVARLHRLLGEVLEREHRYHLTDALETLAWHFEEGGVPGKAYAYLVQTALARLQRGLFEEGLAFVDRALQMEEEARPHMPLEEADRRLAELRIARTRSLYHMGRWEEALADGRRAVTVAERVRDPDLLARAKTRVGYILRNQHQLDEAHALLRQALEHAEAAGDPALAPRPLYHLGAVAWARGDMDEAERCWQRALQISQQAGVRRAEGMAHNGLGILHACRGQPSDARRELEIAADIFREVGMVGYLAIVRVNLIELYLSSGSLRRAWQLTERTIAQAQEVGHSLGVNLGLVWRARLQLVLGRAEEARQTAQEALRIADEIGSVDEQIGSLMTLVEARLALGEGAQSLTEVTMLLDMLRDADLEGLTAQGIGLMVRVLVTRGEHARASTILDGYQPPEVAPHVAVRTELALAHAAAILGREAAATARLRHALELARAHGYRYDELLALHHLAALDAPERRQEHVVRARSLARTLASGLPRRDADDFLARQWGMPTSATEVGPVAPRSR